MKGVTTRMATRIELARKVAGEIAKSDPVLGRALHGAITDHEDDQGLKGSDALAQQVEDVSKYYYLLT